MRKDQHVSKPTEECGGWMFFNVAIPLSPREAWALLLRLLWTNRWQDRYTPSSSIWITTHRSSQLHCTSGSRCHILSFYANGTMVQLLFKVPIRVGIYCISITKQRPLQLVPDSDTKGNIRESL